ncbi:MAG TPA: hypothetical protein VIZ28_08260 [Chitinophagaceae bacterium]
MKLFIFLAGVFLLTISADKCGKKANEAGTCKGKLEIKGLCMNYTIRLLGGNMDTSLVNAAWTNEITGKSYSNVFGLGSPCTFPATINEGDEFYFTIDSSKQECPVCLAYYPTPPKKLSIKVVQK